MSATAVETTKKATGFPQKRRKIDVAYAIQLRVEKGLSLQEIGKHFDCNKASVHRALQKYEHMLTTPGILTAYENARPRLMTAIERSLLLSLGDESAIKSASLNNRAYAANTIYNINRLEQNKSTENISVKSVVSQIRAKLRDLESIEDTQDVVLEHEPEPVDTNGQP